MASPGRQVAEVLGRINDGVLALDKDWRFTYVNGQAASLLGRPPEDLIGKNARTEYPEPEAQQFWQILENAMTAQASAHAEIYCEPWNRWFENSIHPSPDGVTVFFFEITERKQAEQAARESADLLKGQNRVLELIGRGVGLHETLEALVRMIEAPVLEPAIEATMSAISRTLAASCFSRSEVSSVE